MSLAAGVRLGPYEIVAPLGAGGMGEVYRARDTRLDRTVAVKVLPAQVASDPELRQRFDREARAVAALNHPHICTLHDIGSQDGIDFLVMEYLEGETLADRLASSKDRALPTTEALTIAIQLTSALDKAHRAGITHRDLKPANIMLTKGGAKLLDFGLAKTAPMVIDARLSMLPTASPNLTAQGTILGTFQYMAPEQLEGQEADARTDIFAFGAVLYETLTGRRAFDGTSHASLISAILKDEPPPISQVQPLTPPALGRVVSKCLAKDPEARWQTARDLHDELTWIAESGSQAAAAAIATAAPAPSRRREVLVWQALALMLLLTTVGVVVRFAPAPAPQSPAVRFDVPLPDGAPYAGMAISPDGRKLAFVANSQIWVRPIESSSAQALPGTDGALNPFWSADSQDIGFFTPPNRVQKVPASGGPPQLLSTLQFSDTAWQGTWNKEGIILAAGEGVLTGVSDVTLEIVQIPATGGEAVRVTALDASRNETSHRYPRFLPNGRHYVYLAVSRDGTRAAYVGELNSTERQPLPGIASMVEYSPTGHLVFLRNGSLMAQAFDVGKLEMSGESFPIAELGGVPNAVTGPYSVSMNGDLAYRVLPVTGAVGSQLTWVDRAGKQVPVGPVGQYGNIALSTDGKFVVFQRGAPADIWVLDIERNVTSRVTSHASVDSFPVWSPDGQSIVFRSNRDGGGLFRRGFGVVGEEELLLKMPAELGGNPNDWSRDGRYIAYDGLADNTTVTEIWALPMFGDPTPLRITETPYQELSARISPDAHWIVYRSDETGRPVPSPPAPQTPAYIYIQSFPKPGRKWQLSTEQGFMPKWSRDGKEVFYIAPDLTLMSVPIKASGDSLETGTPVSLFKMPLLPLSIATGRPYDVGSDGRRFLVAVTAPAAPVSDTPTTPITVVLNWTSVLGN